MDRLVGAEKLGGIGVPYGSLSDEPQWTTNSVSFQGYPGNSVFRAVVIPQNANGSGTPSAQFISSYQSSVPATAASALVGVPSSVPAGTEIGGFFDYQPYHISSTLTPAGALAWAVRYNNGTELGARHALKGSLLPSLYINSAGTTLRVYSEKTGGVLLQESAPITVTTI